MWKQPFYFLTPVKLLTLVGLLLTDLCTLHYDMKPQHVIEYSEIHSKSKPMTDALTNPHLYDMPFEYMTPNLETFITII